MSAERPHGSNSSAENLLGEGAAQDQSGASGGYMNHAGPNSVPSSPPPSYQHVLEETRLAALTETRTPSKSHRLRISKQASADSVSQDSNRSSPQSRSRLSRRSNTITSTDSGSTQTTRNAEDDRHIARGESWQDFSDFAQKDVGAEQTWQEFSEDGKENAEDYQKPSTSYDSNSRQFDEETNDIDDGELEMNQGERDSEEEVDIYETITESDLEEERRQADERRLEEYECKLRSKQPMPEGYIEVANKTSKAMYLAMAKEMGIVCRMSDQCRCLDCQGGYLDCGEGDGDENIKTDGGLGAGTPMFVSEVFGHGIAPACAIL